MQHRLFLLVKYVIWAGIFGLSALFVLNVIPRATSMALEDLPDHNYVDEIRAHIDEGSYTEAGYLAKYVVENNLPNAQQARLLHDEAERKRTSISNRIKRGAKGFLSGKGTSAEALAGAIASDLLIVGDIRDLGIQGYHWASGNDVDNVIVGLSAVGLVSEVYAPSAVGVSFFKTTVKAGLASKGLLKSLASVVKPVFKSRRMTQEARTTIQSGKQLYDSMGLTRASASLKHVDHVQDLQVVAAAAQKNPDVTIRILESSAALGGNRSSQRGVQLLKAHEATRFERLTLAARKGPEGIRWLADPSSRVRMAVRARYGARVMKTLHLGKPQALLSDILMRSTGAIPWAWGIFTLLVFLTVFNALRIIGVFWPRAKATRSSAFARDTH